MYNYCSINTIIKTQPVTFNLFAPTKANTMKTKNFPYLFIAATITLAACNNSEGDFDAAGAFESVETIVSTEANGTLNVLNVEEGQQLKANQYIGYVDSVQLYLKKCQLEAQIASTTSQIPDIPVQVASLESQLAEAQRNKERIVRLLSQEAATPQQADDANSQVEVIKKQIQAQQSALGITSSTIVKSVAPLQKQIDQINDQLKKCRIINPIHGTVLTKYAQEHEVVMPGKALYKIAETDTLILRAYITGNQIDQVKLNQKVKVRVDKSAKNYAFYPGTIYWISDKAEFTPKTIQTKDERANLVYAIKIHVKNDGYLKIGMYGEIQFKTN